ncbi:hypothetical protein D3C87_260350 [compost metagenome]
MKYVLALGLLVFSISASAGEKVSRKISSDLSDAQSVLSGIEQDKSILSRAIQTLNEDPVLRARMSNGLVVLGVYDSGARFRGDVQRILVKVKEGTETRIDVVTIHQGKAEWSK